MEKKNKKKITKDGEIFNPNYSFHFKTLFEKKKKEKIFLKKKKKKKKKNVLIIQQNKIPPSYRYEMKPKANRKRDRSPLVRPKPRSRRPFG